MWQNKSKIAGDLTFLARNARCAYRQHLKDKMKAIKGSEERSFPAIIDSNPELSNPCTVLQQYVLIKFSGKQRALGKGSHYKIRTSPFTEKIVWIWMWKAKVYWTCVWTFCTWTSLFCSHTASWYLLPFLKLLRSTNKHDVVFLKSNKGLLHL